MLGLEPKMRSAMSQTRPEDVCPESGATEDAWDGTRRWFLTRFGIFLDLPLIVLPRSSCIEQQLFPRGQQNNG